MKKVVVAPHLVLDEEMYGLVIEALGRYAPGEIEALTWERFIRREDWVLVPDVEHPEGDWFKAERKIKHGAPYKQTVKLNVWRTADVKRSGAPSPHSHPWPFVGHVLMGGYEEDRYEVANYRQLLEDPKSSCNVGTIRLNRGVTHAAGEHNKLELKTFHEVTKVLEPGRTLSLMDCELGRKEGWGYLDPDTGLYTPNKQSPIDARFGPMKRRLNPHLASR